MSILILFPFVLACTVSDLKTKRIPNSILLSGFAGALLLRLALILQWILPAENNPGLSAPSALSALLDGCAGFLLPWLLLGPLAALKMIGGADVKLLSVLGLWLGAQGSLLLMWYSLLFAAAWSVVIVIRRRNLRLRLQYLYEYVGLVLVSGRLIPYRDTSGAGNIPKIHSSSGVDSTSNASSSPGACDPSGEFCFALPVLAAAVLLFA